MLMLLFEEVGGNFSQWGPDWKKWVQGTHPEKYTWCQISLSLPSPLPLFPLPVPHAMKTFLCHTHSTPYVLPSPAGTRDCTGRRLKLSPDDLVLSSVHLSGVFPSQLPQRRTRPLTSALLCAEWTHNSSYPLAVTWQIAVTGNRLTLASLEASWRK